MRMCARHFGNKAFPWLVDPLKVHKCSKAIEKSIIRYPNLRKVLDFPIQQIKLIALPKNHTHRDAATLRTSVNIEMSRIVRDAGFTPYTISMSANDPGIGNRFFYFPKDLNIPYRADFVPDDGVLLFTDVDYYADMNKWLLQFKPMIIYTLVPEQASYTGPDFSYFIKDDVVHYTVSGGATYNHKIWDYSGDTISIIGKHGSLLTYHVTQHKLDKDPHRRLITIIPSTITLRPHYEYLDFQDGLRRRKFTFNNKTILYNCVKDTVSIAANGSPHSVSLPGISYAAIKSRLSNKTAPPVISDVERILSADNIDQPQVKAAVLFPLIDDIDYKDNVIQTTSLPCFYQPIKPLITEDGKNPGKAFSNPLTDQTSVFAAKSHNADHACIDGRVVKMRNSVVPPAKYNKYLDEFVELLVPTPGVGTPWSIDQVKRAQNAPAQVARHRLTEASLSTKSKNRLAAMIKTEAYVSTNDPRNITTCAPEHTIGMSSFSLAFKTEVLKKVPWYGPSKTPKQICNRLAKISKNGVIEGDYRRLDGSMTQYTHAPYKRAMMRWLHQDFRAEYEHWHKTCFMGKACTATGVKYDAGESTVSGSSITSDTNTNGVSYVDYVSLRELGHSPKEAWELLGIICGDDSVNPYLPGFAEMMEKVSNDFGLSLVCEVKLKGSSVKYCSRIFVDPSTINDSFQDPLRTIPKLHLTANKMVSNEQAAVNKAAGYIITDWHTPIIGDWCRKVMELTDLPVAYQTREEIYKCTMSWPQSQPDLIRDEFCRVTNITGAELAAAVDRIKKVKHLDGFPTVMTMPFEHKLAAVIGSEIVGPTQRISEKNQINESDDTNKLVINTRAKFGSSEISASDDTSVPRVPKRRSRNPNIDVTRTTGVITANTRVTSKPNTTTNASEDTRVNRLLHPIPHPRRARSSVKLIGPIPKPRLTKPIPLPRTKFTVVADVHPEPNVKAVKCPETKNKPMPNKSKSHMKDGKTPVANISNSKSKCKKRKRKNSKKKVPTSMT